MFSMILRLLKGGQSEAGGHSASNLSLTLMNHPARMPDGPAKKPDAVHDCLSLTEVLWSVTAFI